VRRPAAERKRCEFCTRGPAGVYLPGGTAVGSDAVEVISENGVEQLCVAVGEVKVLSTLLVFEGLLSDRRARTSHSGRAHRFSAERKYKVRDAGVGVERWVDAPDKAAGLEARHSQRAEDTM
jgi:hypothetical protein